MTHPFLSRAPRGRVGGVGGLVVEALQRRGRAGRAIGVVSRLVRPEFLVVIEIVAAKA